VNIAEKLAREIGRVATIKAHYEEAGRLPGVNTKMAEAVMEQALERAYLASGGDALEIMKSVAELEDFSE
jgi:endonuclease III